MSVFPQSLYHPTAKDLAADFNPVQVAQLSGATGLFLAPTTGEQNANAIPQDRVLLVNSVSGVGIPGAAQFVTRVRLRWGFLTSAGVFAAIGDLKNSGTIAGAANAEVAIDWQPGPPGFVLLAQQLIQLEITFNAAAANNTVSLCVNGVLIPRGNWQRS